MQNKIVTKKYSVMKTKFIIFIVLSPFFCFSQHLALKKALEDNRVKEVSGSFFNYYFIEDGEMIVLMNKNAHLMHEWSDYELFDYASRQVTTHGREKLDSLIFKYFVPLLKENFQRNVVMSIRLDLYSDSEGHIKELITSYPAEIELPITEYESFEREVLTCGIKFIFDRNRREFKNSIWVTIPYFYPIDKITTRPVDEWRKP